MSYAKAAAQAAAQAQSLLTLPMWGETAATKAEAEARDTIAQAAEAAAQAAEAAAQAAEAGDTEAEAKKAIEAWEAGSKAFIASGQFLEKQADKFF